MQWPPKAGTVCLCPKQEGRPAFAQPALALNYLHPAVSRPHPAPLRHVLAGLGQSCVGEDSAGRWALSGHLCGLRSEPQGEVPVPFLTPRPRPSRAAVLGLGQWAWKVPPQSWQVCSQTAVGQSQTR